MISLRTTMTPTGRRSHTACTALVATVVILQVILMLSKRIEAMPYHQRTLRLCSRSLSDALFLVCKDRGFNEPFSYSGEVNDEEERRPASTTGPRRGLVQECCHRSCSIEHLERYCKPLPQPTQRDDTATRGNAIGSKSAAIDKDNDKAYKIVSLPYSSVRELQVTSNSNITAVESEHQTVRAPRTKRRKKGRRRKYATVCQCRRPKRRQKRLRKSWRKVSRETVIPKVPAFQVGTTSPEPIDSIVIFPFKSELSLEHVDGAMQGQEKDLRRPSR